MEALALSLSLEAGSLYGGSLRLSLWRLSLSMEAGSLWRLSLSMEVGSLSLGRLALYGGSLSLSLYGGWRSLEALYGGSLWSLE
eukprot:6680277-Alexandrium_andersonii.AAC.1